MNEERPVKTHESLSMLGSHFTADERPLFSRLFSKFPDIFEINFLRGYLQCPKSAISFSELY